MVCWEWTDGALESMKLPGEVAQKTVHITSGLPLALFLISHWLANYDDNRKTWRKRYLEQREEQKKVPS